MLPGQLGDVHQAVHTAQIHESTEVDDGGNHAIAHLALFELVEEGGANLRLGLLKPCTAGEHHVVAVLIKLNDLRFKLLTNVGCEVTDASHLNQ